MAEPTTVQSEQLKYLLKCSICLKIYTDPRTLSCLHTFCFQCIVQWCKDKRPGDKVACPECRTEFFIPNSVIGFKKNFFIGNLLAMHEVKHSTADLVEICEICAEDEKHMAVEMFCLQCEQKYCKSCSNAHSRMKNSNLHTMVSYTTYCDELRSGVDINKKYRSTFCVKHKDKPIELFCFEDEEAICLMCYVNDHNAHKFQAVKIVANEFRVGLEQDHQMISNAQSKLDENLRKLKSRKESLFEQVRTVETKISERADQMKEMIENEKQKLLFDLRGFNAKHEAEIDRLMEECNQAKILLISFTNYCEELLKKGSDPDISREASCLRKRAQELLNMNKLEDAWKNLDVTNITFTPSSMTFDEAKNIGHVTTDETHIFAHTLLADSGSIDALALMNDELFVTRYDVKHVSVYDTKRLKLKRNISIPQLGPKLVGLAACPSNKLLFISDYENDSVHTVDLSTDSVNSWRTAREPLGLSLTSLHNLLVTCDCPPLCKIQEYTSTGTLIREISHGNRLCHAVETRSGTLLVSRCGPIHGVAELTWTGLILRSHGNKPGSGKGQMNCPRSLAVTANGVVLVADEDNDRIQLLDSSLTTTATALVLQLTDGITVNRPRALCYDETRQRLFVGECDGKCRVLVFDHVTNLDVTFE